MKILHIIPSAFDYFTDIKKAAFKIVEKLSQTEIEIEVITLQYDQPSKKARAEISGDEEKQISGVAPSYDYSGQISLKKSLDSLPDFDLIHLHVPFLGGARSIIQDLKKENMPPLLISYYRPILLVDFFSLLIKWYNQYYLSRLFSLAKIVTYFPQTCSDFILYKISADKVVNITVDSNEENSIKLDVRAVHGLKLDQNQSIYISIDKLRYLYYLLTKTKLN